MASTGVAPLAGVRWEGGGACYRAASVLCSPVCTTPAHRGPTFTGAFFRPLAYPYFCSVSLKDFPPYLTRQASLLSGSILGPVWGLFRYPPLRCRGKALAGSGGRYVVSVDNCAGMRLPVQAGERSSWYPSMPLHPARRPFPLPGGGGGLRCQRTCQCLTGCSRLALQFSPIQPNPSNRAIPNSGQNGGIMWAKLLKSLKKKKVVFYCFFSLFPLFAVRRVGLFDPLECGFCRASPECPPVRFNLEP